MFEMTQEEADTILQSRFGADEWFAPENATSKVKCIKTAEKQLRLLLGAGFDVLEDATLTEAVSLQALHVLEGMDAMKEAAQNLIQGVTSERMGSMAVDKAPSFEIRRLIHPEVLAMLRAYIPGRVVTIRRG